MQYIGKWGAPQSGLPFQAMLSCVAWERSTGVQRKCPKVGANAVLKGCNIITGSSIAVAEDRFCCRKLKYDGFKKVREFSVQWQNDVRLNQQMRAHTTSKLNTFSRGLVWNYCSNDSRKTLLGETSFDSGRYGTIGLRVAILMIKICGVSVHGLKWPSQWECVWLCAVNPPSESKHFDQSGTTVLCWCLLTAQYV